MTDCKGLFGKWFGHNFERRMIKLEGSIMFFENISQEELMKHLSNGGKELDEIRCKRCGVKADES